MSRTRLASLGLVFAVAALLAGCTARASRPAAPPAANPTSVSAMQVAARQTQLPSDFPIEVPVPAGRVTRAEAQGRMAWDYEVAIAASPVDVAAWYKQALTAREWRVTKDSVAADGTGILELTKGSAAQTTVSIEKLGKGSHATVTVGLGVPVNSTL